MTEYIEELRKVDAFTSVIVRVPKPAEPKAPEPAQKPLEQAVKRVHKS